MLYAASYQRRRTSCCFNGGGPGSAIWKTDDAGKTWTKLTQRTPARHVRPHRARRLRVESEHRLRADRSRRERHGLAVAAAPTPAKRAAAGAAGGGGGGGGGAAAIDWCNNGAPVPRSAVAADAGSRWCRGAAPADTTGRRRPHRRRSIRRQRHVPLGQQGSLVDARQQLRRAPDVLQPAARRSAEPQHDLRRGSARREVARRRQDVRYARRRRRQRRAGARRPARDLGRSEELEAPHDRQRRRLGHLATTRARRGTSSRRWRPASRTSVTADNERPYNVYTGLQDNNSWGGPSSKRGRGGITNTDWFGICGGDGFYTAVNVERSNIVYSESQDGNTSRYDLNTGQTDEHSSARRARAAGVGAGAHGRTCVDGRAPGGGRGGGGGGGRGGGRANVINATPGEAYRFNWNTPYILSPHNPSIIYLGGNRLFKSYDRGDELGRERRSHEAGRSLQGHRHGRRRRQDAAVEERRPSRRTARSSAVSESPVMPGIVWAGTDDGNLQVSRDGGADVHGSRQEHHRHAAGRAHERRSVLDLAHRCVAFRRRRPRTSPSTDIAATTCIRTSSSRATTAARSRASRAICRAYGNIQVVTRRSEEQGSAVRRHRVRLCTSRSNGGKHWEKFMNDYPTVRTDDIFIHPREGDVIVATHGRSIWIADDITPLEQLRRRSRSADVYLFAPRAGRRVGQRHHEQSAHRRAEELRRRKRAARHGDQLLPQVRRRRT